LIDPTKEIPAFIEAVDAGMTSMQRVQREQGLDPEVIRAERVQDIEKDKEAKLPARVPATKPPTVNVTQGG
jgi:capsid protein